ncbi:MAG: RHS repeat-associated core domain-containing protein [Desulfococcaceae bacterium]|jgi:RHS repeat-associated protein|nr:RHS repeat-associated core domain-containing protein [Desulfococcaceae bacterium]
MPFGKARILIADIENNLRFPGQYYDRETGLHYNYHRYYDPDTGEDTSHPIPSDWRAESTSMSVWTGIR